MSFILGLVAQFFTKLNLRVSHRSARWVGVVILLFYLLCISNVYICYNQPTSTRSLPQYFIGLTFVEETKMFAQAYLPVAVNNKVLEEYSNELLKINVRPSRLIMYQTYVAQSLIDYQMWRLVILNPVNFKSYAYTLVPFCVNK